LETNRLTRHILWLALRAIGYADVRFGILPAQSDRRCAASGMTKKIGSSPN
jgi:hypothetical protein